MKPALKLLQQAPDAPDADADYFACVVEKRTHGRIRIVVRNDYTSSHSDDRHACFDRGHERPAGAPFRVAAPDSAVVSTGKATSSRTTLKRHGNDRVK